MLIARVLKLLSFVYYFSMGVVCLTGIGLLGIWVYAGSNILFGTPLGKALSTIQEPALKDPGLFVWIVGGLAATIGILGLNGKIFRQLSLFAKAFKNNESNVGQRMHLKNLPVHFIFLYAIGILGNVGHVLFVQRYGEAFSALTQQNLTGAVVESAVPGFQGPSCLVIALVLWWYNRWVEELEQEVELTI